MLINRPPDIPSSEITDESLFWNRRNFLKVAGLGAAAAAVLLVRLGSRVWLARDRARARRSPSARTTEPKPTA